MTPSLKAWLPTLHLLLLAVASVGCIALNPSLSPLRWDAAWYDAIRLHDYDYSPDAQSTAGFFPGFPYLWRWTHLPAAGMGLLNLAVAGGASALLQRQLSLRPAAVLLYWALPGALFLAVPYSEALFFAATALVLLGLKRGQLGLTLAGLFAAGLVRASAMFLLPALLVVLGLRWLADPARRGRHLRDAVLSGAGVVAGLATVCWWQWHRTGVWLAYAKAQKQHWDHYLRLPGLPFTDQAGEVLALDGLALLVGLAAGGWALRRLLRRPLPRPGSAGELTVFAAVFVATTVVYTLLFAPQDAAGHTDLLSLHRYVVATPFGLLLLNAFLPTHPPGRRTWAALLGATAVLAAVLGALAGPLPLTTTTATVHGAVLLLALPGYAALWLSTWSTAGRALAYAVGVTLQLGLLYAFQAGFWVG